MQKKIDFFKILKCTSTLINSGTGTRKSLQTTG